jgi:glycerol uptake facilitator-like aquaporin
MYYLQCLTEFIGTLVVFYIILSSNGDAISIGIAFAALILFSGKISGGNLNPAVSFMMYLNNKMPLSQMILYIGSQLLAAYTALWIFNNKTKFLM